MLKKLEWPSVYRVRRNKSVIHKYDIEALDSN